MTVFTPTICVFATRREDAAPMTTMASYDGIIRYQRPQGVGRGLSFFPPRGLYPPIYIGELSLCLGSYHYYKKNIRRSQ